MMKGRIPVCIVGVLGAAVLATPSAEALEIIVGMPYGKHRIGHTAVRVRTFDADKEVIYDFGRYGRTWGHLGLHGEGIMRVWRGPQAVQRYLNKQTSYRDSWGYTIAVDEATERRVLAWYERLLKRARSVKDHPQHKRYRLAADYHGVTNQCTSVALDGLKHAWPRPRWEALLQPRFNKGQGFDSPTKRYFYSEQKKRGINETVVPLDVKDSLDAAASKAGPVQVTVRAYPCRTCRAR